MLEENNSDDLALGHEILHLLFLRRVQTVLLSAKDCVQTGCDPVHGYRSNYGHDLVAHRWRDGSAGGKLIDSLFLGLFDCEREVTELALEVDSRVWLSETVETAGC